MSGYAVVISCRMNSERLPGKALSELWPGLTVLHQLVRRWRASARQPDVIVAATEQPADDAIADACRALDVPCHRGRGPYALHHMDGALREFAPHAEYVARALADNPLVDVDLCDWRLDKLKESGAQGLWYGVEYDREKRSYMVHERITYAGTTDVWGRKLWDEIAAESSGSQLSHPGAYFWDTLHKHERRVRLLPLPRAEYVSQLVGFPPVRTELDEPADLEMFRAVWQAWAEQVGPYPCVSTPWALRWLSEHPDVAALNRRVATKTMSRVGERSTRKPKRCPDCGFELGQVSQEGVESHCSRCGTTHTVYHSKPKHARPGH